MICLIIRGRFNLHIDLSILMNHHFKVDIRIIKTRLGRFCIFNIVSLTSLKRKTGLIKVTSLR